MHQDYPVFFKELRTNEKLQVRHLKKRRCVVSGSHVPQHCRVCSKLEVYLKFLMELGLACLSDYEYAWAGSQIGADIGQKVGKDIVKVGPVQRNLWTQLHTS